MTPLHLLGTIVDVDTLGAGDRVMFPPDVDTVWTVDDVFDDEDDPDVVDVLFADAACPSTFTKGTPALRLNPGDPDGLD